MIMEVDFVTSDIIEGDTLEFDDNIENSNFEGETCGICMDIIIDRGVLDCCQHWFCFGCIDNWATITNLCPLCQKEFQLITCVPVYDTIGNNKIDDDSSFRDDEWSIEGKNNTLSFPSYYIDENAVVCLDGDGCKIRSGSLNIEGDSNLDTSIACDSCDVWYHAFCVGFDPEGTSEDSWLCPRCVAGTVPQESHDSSMSRSSSHCDQERYHISSLPGSTFSGKLSISVADAGETAVVVSMVDANMSDETSKAIHSVAKELKIDASDENIHEGQTTSGEKIEMQPKTEGHGLELSLPHDSSICQPSTSLVLSELNSSCADADMNLPSRSDDVKGLRMALNDFDAGNRLSESETYKVDHAKIHGTEDQVNEDVHHQSLADKTSLTDKEVVPDTNEKAVPMVGLKRKHTTEWSGDVHKTASDKEDNVKIEDTAPGKKIRARGKHQMESKDDSDEFPPDDPDRCLASITIPKDVKSKRLPEKDDVIIDIMSIVKGPKRRPPKGLATDKSSKENENAAGLRVKKIMRRATADKESSSVVQKLRAEIREAVRRKASADIGENLFDPKLLAAFRTVVAGPTTEVVEKLPPSAVKAKKSLLQKGKIRENLTKKIYGNSNGKRKRAWDRECEVEFWKHRCMRATKPEKIATLKSVLNLLRKNPEGSGTEQTSERQAANPILSRLYLADTSVFPRKDDIKPLSALSTGSNSEQNKGLQSSTEKGESSSFGDRIQQLREANKVSSKLPVSAVPDKGSKDKVQISKGINSPSKAHPDKAANASLQASSGGSKVNSPKEKATQSDDRKVDKRKWALEVLARKKAALGTSATQEKQEDNALIKTGNYPLLAQLPIDMRPELGQSRHNKVPISVRQVQLYRLAEHFLKKLNLPEIRKTAETELAIADAVNIEKGVADKSNSKVVYLNLCSQEISRRSDNNGSIKDNESDPSPILLRPAEQSEQASEVPTDSVIVDALKNAGLLSDSPPSSPRHHKETFDETGNSHPESNNEGPDNILEMDSLPEADIYGEFEYDLEDEDYIGVAATKVPKLPLEHESRVKVVFSTLKHEKSDDFQDLKDGRSEDIDESNHSSPQLKSDSGIGIISLTTEIGIGTDHSSGPPEISVGEECSEPSFAACEELYGPDKEPIISKFPEDIITKVDGLIGVEAPAENLVSRDAGHKIIASVAQNSCEGEISSKQSGINENTPRKDKPKMDSNKQSDSISSVSKKVEAYIKEHIRPLCKSGVITAEQYRWAVAKTTDKVMKYHPNAKNANFLIKEGEKVKKLAAQYVEAAQQKDKSDLV